MTAQDPVGAITQNRQDPEGVIDQQVFSEQILSPAQEKQPFERNSKIQSSLSDLKFMEEALSLAQQAYDNNEVPVGAVLVREGKIIGRGFNQSITQKDPSAHAEIVALREAAKNLKNYRLVNTTLYVTLEPCPMCIGAMIHARIERLVFAAKDPKTGAVCSVCNWIDASIFNHKISWEQGPCADQSANLLRDFFQQRRKKINIGTVVP